MRSTAVHANTVATEVLGEIRIVQESVKEALTMIQAEIPSPSPNESANFVRTNDEDKS